MSTGAAVAAGAGVESGFAARELIGSAWVDDTAEDDDTLVAGVTVEAAMVDGRLVELLDVWLLDAGFVGSVALADVFGLVDPGVGFLRVGPAPPEEGCAPPELDTTTPGATSPMVPDVVLSEPTMVCEPEVEPPFASDDAPAVTAPLVASVLEVSESPVEDSDVDDADDVGPESVGSAHATPPPDMAVPTPSATARAPTRPMYVQ